MGREKKFSRLREQHAYARAWRSRRTDSFTELLSSSMWRRVE
jgi:hypothetical protein